mmetsp:Transcript_31825/g.99351  ORF Transcript_31825/g.99351 Transcript_31825/m.99351 type:complete len:216 (-) Transcript_31825:94-741(-)
MCRCGILCPRYRCRKHRWRTGRPLQHRSCLQQDWPRSREERAAVTAYKVERPGHACSGNCQLLKEPRGVRRPRHVSLQKPGGHLLRNGGQQSLFFHLQDSKGPGQVGQVLWFTGPQPHAGLTRKRAEEVFVPRGLRSKGPHEVRKLLRPEGPQPRQGRSSKPVHHWVEVVQAWAKLRRRPSEGCKFLRLEALGLGQCQPCRRTQQRDLHKRSGGE